MSYPVIVGTPPTGYDGTEDQVNRPGRDIAVPLLRAILREIEVPVDEFLDLLD
jgi:hypothetical protein